MTQKKHIQNKGESVESRSLRKYGIQQNRLIPGKKGYQLSKKEFESCLAGGAVRMNSAEPAQYFSRPTHPHQKDSQFAIRTGRKREKCVRLAFRAVSPLSNRHRNRRVDQGVFFACMNMICMHDTTQKQMDVRECGCTQCVLSCFTLALSRLPSNGRRNGRHVRPQPRDT